MPRPDRRDRPLRIAYLTPTLETGGAERQMLILAANLPRDEFEVRFLLLSRPGAMADEARAAGASLYRLGLDHTACAAFRPGCLPAALRAIRRYRALTADVDIVDAWLVPSQIFAAAARPFAPVPVLIGGRRSLDDVYATKSRARRMLASVAARRMDLVVANSCAAADDAMLHDGIDPSRVRVIPNAVLPAPGPLPRATIRQGWGIDDESLVVVGCVGNYKPEKGHRHLIEAAARLRQGWPLLRFVLVGEGPLRGDLEAQIRRLDLSEVVILAGPAADARETYAGFDIVVQASDTEGLPNVILEAAAAGSAIVATAVGGTAEVLTDRRDGILVPKADVGALVAAIERLASDPMLRRQLGAAARARSAAFAPERLVTATAEMYRQLIADAPPARRRDRSASTAS
jgi:glycosyltransferase involved in cell wall biosynthesis